MEVRLTCALPAACACTQGLRERPSDQCAAAVATQLAVLYFGLGSQFLPGHSAWVTLLLWVSSQIGAFVAYQASGCGHSAGTASALLGPWC
jgi:hypothetical protein